MTVEENDDIDSCLTEVKILTEGAAFGEQSLLCNIMIFIFTSNIYVYSFVFIYSKISINILYI